LARVVDLDKLREGWLATARANCEGRLKGAAHRGLDLAGALALLLFTSPVLLLAALAVKLDSPGPVFYRQERVGRGAWPLASSPASKQRHVKRG
jgi:lipopolysaccharide/colanic/teichoic acid biosynthesis glycosyltransferase